VDHRYRGVPTRITRWQGRRRWEDEEEIENETGCWLRCLWCFGGERDGTDRTTFRQVCLPCMTPGTAQDQARTAAQRDRWPQGRHVRGLTTIGRHEGAPASPGTRQVFKGVHRPLRCRKSLAPAMAFRACAIRRKSRSVAYLKGSADGQRSKRRRIRAIARLRLNPDAGRRPVRSHAGRRA